MKKLSEKQFRHLMSAMLFISDVLDKDEQIMHLFVQYKEQNFEPDPVAFIREALNGCRPGTHDMYVRRSFTARAYQEVKPG